VAHDGLLAHQRATPRSQRLFTVLFVFLILVCLVYAGRGLVRDLSAVHTASGPAYLLLAVSLLIALGFEFVNGFHDAANAVATVIYTNSLSPRAAVIWSGLWHFIGVMVSSGAVAFGVVSLLPVELIMDVGSDAGFAMVFALLLAAMGWNLGTWFLGLPVSSSHTLIGSVIGVGLANQIMQPDTATAGVDWNQAYKVGYALLLSPVLGFIAAAALLLGVKRLIRKRGVYRPPQAQSPPPFWTRLVLILTSTGVSFAHGSNDGQKGMGLIMLILIGTFPTAFALNLTISAEHMRMFMATSDQATAVLSALASNPATSAKVQQRMEVWRYVRTEQLQPATIPALSALMRTIKETVAGYRSYVHVPDEMKGRIRNDMYLVDEALRLVEKSVDAPMTTNQKKALEAYRKELDRATEFIPIWVKVAVAFALGLGTMVGWRRIVVTVGEKIGKAHLTYAQGATAETVAAGTIAAADAFGLPVSTTHVLSSAVAGTMVANRSGLQAATVRNILIAWILTLPISISLAGGLYWLFRFLGEFAFTP
jgi:PiT family inorganic phosphate transporter